MTNRELHEHVNAGRIGVSAVAGVVRLPRDVHKSSEKPAVKPPMLPAEVEARIEAAFTRCAVNDARCIQVSVTDGKVRLRGSVHSWDEREQACHAAWSTPGVVAVEDWLVVSPR